MPIASRQSDIKTTARYFFKIISFPPKLQSLATNPVMRQFLKPFRDKFAQRSDVWIAESNKEIRAAIAKTNLGFLEPRVFRRDSDQAGVKLRNDQPDGLGGGAEP